MLTESHPVVQNVVMALSAESEMEGIEILPLVIQLLPMVLKCLSEGDRGRLKALAHNAYNKHNDKYDKRMLRRIGVLAWVSNPKLTAAQRLLVADAILDEARLGNEDEIKAFGEMQW